MGASIVRENYSLEPENAPEGLQVIMEGETAGHLTFRLDGAGPSRANIVYSLVALHAVIEDEVASDEHTRST